MSCIPIPQTNSSYSSYKLIAAPTTALTGYLAAPTLVPTALGSHERRPYELVASLTQRAYGGR